MPVIKKGENPHRPPTGSSTKVSPIMDKTAIKNIKRKLEYKPRDYCLFTLGINTAFRAGELRLIKAGQVRHLKPMDSFELKQSKTKTYRRVSLNKTCIDAIQRLLNSKPFVDEEYLFMGKRGLLKVSTINNLVKEWCEGEKLLRGKGNYGSHTLRKTWGYWQRKERNTPLPLLMEAFGHKTQKGTLDYLCIQSDEIQDIYSLEL